MANIGWYIICLVAGILLDWAMVGRLVLCLEMLSRHEPKRAYRDTLFPRLYATLIGLALIGVGSAVSSPPEIPFYPGLIIFSASMAWGVARSFR
jgi:hypothetical protein